MEFEVIPFPVFASVVSRSFYHPIKECVKYVVVRSFTLLRINVSIASSVELIIFVTVRVPSLLTWIRAECALASLC